MATARGFRAAAGTAAVIPNIIGLAAYGTRVTPQVNHKVGTGTSGGATLWGSTSFSSRRSRRLRLDLRYGSLHITDRGAATCRTHNPPARVQAMSVRVEGGVTIPVPLGKKDNPTKDSIVDDCRRSAAQYRSGVEINGVGGSSIAAALETAQHINNSAVDDARRLFVRIMWFSAQTAGGRRNLCWLTLGAKKRVERVAATAKTAASRVWAR